MNNYNKKGSYLTYYDYKHVYKEYNNIKKDPVKTLLLKPPICLMAISALLPEIETSIVSLSSFPDAVKREPEIHALTPPSQCRGKKELNQICCTIFFAFLSH